MKLGKRSRILELSLDEVARRLRDDRINRVVAGYRERAASIKRLLLVTALLGWTVFWMTRAPGAHDGSSLWIEARHLFPWMIGLFVASVLWTSYVWWRKEPPTDWMEQGGAIANYIGIWVMLHEGWNIAISMITFLPLATIVIGARFSRRAFFLGMAFSVLLLATAAPPGYWSARPAFIPFALILLVGLPLTVIRLLSALYAVSAAAVLSRDAQTRIIAMISHELRTPLNTISNATHLIDTSHLPQEDQELMGAVSTNAQALLYRVNQVLDVAAIDNRGLYLSSEPFLVIDLVRAVHDMVDSYSKEAGVSVKFDMDTEVPDGLFGDAGRIEQVLTNLVSNAIKFTPDGGRVKVRMERRDVTVAEGTVPLRFSVSDTGIGISDADKDQIFSPFYQVSHGPKRHEGVGLGLHIVKGVSEQMGGRLSVADHEGGGTVFYWDVELAVATLAQQAATASGLLEEFDTHRSRTPSMRCLIVDDNRPNREILGRILSRAGHISIFAADGLAGLEQLRDPTSVDVVFLDMHMPRMSGEEVLQELRARSIAVPIVVLSADSSPDVIARARALGSVAYLMKPASPKKVMNVLENLSASHIGLRASEPHPESAIAILRLLGDSVAVHNYLHVVGTEMVDAFTAAKRCIAEGRSDLAQQHLHALMNSFRNLGDGPGIAETRDVSDALCTGDDLSAKLNILHDRIEEQQRWLASQPEFSSDHAKAI